MRFQVSVEVYSSRTGVSPDFNEFGEVSNSVRANWLPSLESSVLTQTRSSALTVCGKHRSLRRLPELLTSGRLTGLHSALEMPMRCETPSKKLVR